ncbi:MAG: hypothetical protein II527_08450 [Bacteroidales bacterium]|nr:hypothetical protein [Bacteroidales bacterium]
METTVRIATLLIMFWNLENFFYPQKDVDFSSGEKVVTWKRFRAKRDLISKTIIAIKDKEGAYPSVIGVCEVENLKTLRNLVYDTPLSRLGYRILHKDSPDSRGIDVALLYRDDRMILLEYSFFEIKSFKTRDILYAKMLSVELKDTVHFLVNHWPSKLGGEKKSLPRRMEAANLLRHIVDSVQKVNPKAKIIAMGDFNDSPSSPSLQSITSLENLSLRLKDSLKKARASITGTHRYKGRWEMLDQFLVSKTINGNIQILSFDHLLQQDKKYLGYKTKRTFIGLRFNGGASDHLPILLKIID